MSSEVKVKTEPDANDVIPQKTFVRANNNQRAILKAAFQANNNPLPKDIDEMAVQTGLEFKWIRSWFVRERGSKKRAGKAKAIIAEDTVQKDPALDPKPASEEGILSDAIALKKKKQTKKQPKKREQPPPAVTTIPLAAVDVSSNELRVPKIEYQEPVLSHSSSPVSTSPSFSFSDLELHSRCRVSDTSIASAFTDYDTTSYSLHSDIPGSSPLPQSSPNFSSPLLSKTRHFTPLSYDMTDGSKQNFPSSPPVSDTHFMPKLLTPLDENMLEHYLKYASHSGAPSSSPDRSTRNRTPADTANSSSPAPVGASSNPRTYDELFDDQREPTANRRTPTNEDWYHQNRPSTSSASRQLSSPVLKETSPASSATTSVAFDGIPIGDPLPLHVPAQIFDRDFAEQEPFQAAMGLVALSKLGLKWD